MGGLELLLIGLLPLALLALAPDGGQAVDSDEADAAEVESSTDPACGTGTDLLSVAARNEAPGPGLTDGTEADDADLGATDVAVPTVTGTLAAGEADLAPRSGIWPETEWPETRQHETAWRDPVSVPAAEGQPGDGGAASPVPPGHPPVKGDPADWPEFDRDARTADRVFNAGSHGPDTLIADTPVEGVGGYLLHANWTAELATAQGSDLFAWRDDGVPDTLIGGEGDDRLVMARGDTASGGGGANVFEVWNDPDSPHPAAVVTDFTPGTDRLDIVTRIDEAAHPDCGAWDWDRAVGAAHFATADLEILRDPDTAVTEIRVNGTIAAQLHGAPAISAADLRLFAFWDIHS